MKKQTTPFSILFLLLGLIVGNAHAQPVLMKVLPIGSTNFVSTQNRLFFTSGDTLWTSNGTSASTYFIKKTGEPFIEVTNLRLGTFIYFTTLQSDGKTALWRTNGTGANTQKIAAYPKIKPQIVYNGALYLGIDDGVHGYELWRINLSNTLTLVKDLNPGAGDGLSGRIIISSSTLYFPAFAGPGGFNIWKSTGTNASTVLAVDLPFFDLGLNLTDVNGTIFFTRSYSIGFINYGEVWKSNGTTAGTSIIKSFSSEDVTYYFSDLINFNNKLYYNFQEDPGIYINSLWTSDGTSLGTVKVKDLYIDTQMAPYIVTNNHIVMTGYDGFQLPLIKSDGTPEGTDDFYTFSAYYALTIMAATPELLFFTDNATVSGLETFDEIYQSDLTNANSVSLRELFGPSFAGSSNLTPADDNIYFTTRLPYSSDPEERKLRLYYYNPNQPSSNVPYFTLVNASTNEDISWLHNNATIFKPDTLQINVRFNPSATPGSVTFHLNSIPYRTENTAPFSLAGDTGGDYNPWLVTPGNYNISATPYSLPNGTGTPGPVSNVFVYVVNPSITRSASYDVNDVSGTSETVKFEAYPNPSSDQFTFSVLNKEYGTAKAEIYKMDGTLVERLIERNVGEGESVEFTWNGNSQQQGVYMCKYTSGSQQVTKKIVLTR